MTKQTPSHRYRLRVLTGVLLTPLLLLASACKDNSATPPTPEPHQPVAVPTSASPQSGTSPAAELAALDQRVPVPLQPMMAWHQKQNMMRHLVVIQQVTAALPREDWDAIVTAAESIGTSPKMQQMCEHMGAGAEGFAEAALAFHQGADTIAEAARNKDAAAVLKTTATTLQACTACHAVFRQDVVDAATWRTRTSQRHTSPAKQHMH